MLRKYFEWVVRSISFLIIMATILIILKHNGYVDCFKTYFTTKIDKDSVNSVIKCWLAKKDKGIFNRCKIFIGDEDSLYPGPAYHEDEKYLKVNSWVCGEQTQYWVSKKTKKVERCFENTGKKIFLETFEKNSCE